MSLGKITLSLKHFHKSNGFLTVFIHPSSRPGMGGKEEGEKKKSSALIFFVTPAKISVISATKEGLQEDGSQALEYSG